MLEEKMLKQIEKMIVLQVVEKSYNEYTFSRDNYTFKAILLGCDNLNINNIFISSKLLDDKCNSYAFSIVGDKAGNIINDYNIDEVIIIEASGRYYLMQRVYG